MTNHAVLKRSDSRWGWSMSAQRGTILVVDDDSVLRRLLATVLKLRGYQVLVAEDGVQALSTLREHGNSVDLILADIIMPQMDGWRATQLIRNQLKLQTPSTIQIFLEYISPILGVCRFPLRRGSSCV